MLHAILVMIGVGIGIAISMFITHRKSVGVLFVSNDVDGPELFLKLSEPVSEVCKQDYVFFEVRVKR